MFDEVNHIVQLDCPGCKQEVTIDLRTLDPEDILPMLCGNCAASADNDISEWVFSRFSPS